MDPTELLSKDYRLIERVLASLDTAARRLQVGAPVRAALFLEVADFMQGFVDDCHHRKEEQHLFPALQDAGFPRWGGPIGVMLAEHEDGRQYAAGLRAAVSKLAVGDESATRTLAESARGYVDLLRQHIQKEDSVLFAMAQHVLPAETRSALMQTFERIARETGGHEKWLPLAVELEQVTGG